MRGSNPRRIHQSALFVGFVALSTSIINPPQPLRKCGNTRHLVKGSEEQLTQGSSILPSRTSEVCKSAWLVSAATGNSYKFTVGRDTPEPIRSGRLCKTPLRRDGQRTENPLALAVGSVKGWFGGTPLHEPAYRGIAKRSKAWDFDSHIRRFKSCYPCQPPVGVLRARS